MNGELLFTAIYDNVSGISEYKCHELEIRKLGRIIMEALGANRALFLEYEKLIYLIEGLSLESAYELGLADLHADPSANQNICTA